MASKEYYKEYYRKNRSKRIAQSTAYQAAHKDEKKQYLSEYYRANKHKYKPRTPEQRAAYNAKRRADYAKDPSIREQCRKQASQWSKENPIKRKSQRLREFGTDLEWYNSTLSKQGGACAICGHSDMSKPRIFPHIDHCHTTGKPRGLLCGRCNIGLGYFRDDPELLKGAIKYLRASKKGSGV
jgi:hypothetical protein